MLVCGPFHSVTNPPVGMGYLRSFLEQRGHACPTRDLNIEARSHLLEVTGDKGLIDQLFSQSCRTYLAEAAVWSWHHPGGAEEVVRRVERHPCVELREFWLSEGIARLLLDSSLIRGLTILRSWLNARCEEIADAAAEDWVGFSTVITNLASNLYIARRLKEIRPELLLLFGGPEVTTRNASELLESFPWVDAAVPAPAYEPLVSLLTDLKSNRQGDAPPPGVWRRQGDAAVRGDPSSTWPNLDKLPPADWRGFDMAAYEVGFILRGYEDLSRWYPTIPLHTSQGCSHNRCGFCYNITLYPLFNVQSPQRVLLEIAHQIEATGSCGFFFTDFEFNAAPIRVKRICRLLRELDQEIRFSAWLRLDKLDLELLELMYEAGARQLFIGVEAVDDDLLRLMNKGYNAGTALERLNLLHDFWVSHFDFHFEFNLIRNYPGETLQSVRSTLARIAENPQIFMHRVAAVADFMLHEGTPAHREAEAGPTAGCLEPLLPEGSSLRSYRYFTASRRDDTYEKRREIWNAIRGLVERNA